MTEEESVMIEEEKMKWKIEYHDGYYSAGNDIPFDENKSTAWKEGYLDGMATLMGE